MSGLLDRELVVVAGKGGVGRTTITAALGLLGVRDGGSDDPAGDGPAGDGPAGGHPPGDTAMIEMTGAGSLATLFPGGDVDYTGREVAPGLYAFSISAKQSVEEYLLRHIRFRAVYDLVFGNRYIAPFMDAVLGLSDLISLGKVMDMGWEVDDDGHRRYRRLLVDAPATGHGLTMLRAPRAMMEIARTGPLFHNAQLVDELLSDPARAALVLVTLPEEMPVNETLEMARAVQRDGTIRLAAVVINGVPVLPFAPDEEAAYRALLGSGVRVGGQAARALREASRMLSYRQAAQRHVDRLRDVLSVPIVEVPLLPSRRIDAAGLQRIAGCLEGLA